MPRVNFVRKAAKDNRVVKKGESYYWWKFRFGPKMMSRTRPRRSQLTQSEYYSQMYDLEDDFDPYQFETAEEVSGYLEDIRSQIEGVKDEIEDKMSNMEYSEGLQYTPAYEMLEQRRDALDNLIYEFDESISQVEGMEDLEDLWDHEGVDDNVTDDMSGKEILEAKQEWMEDRFRSDVEDAVSNIGWEIE